jgi:hypothetical protein
MKCKWLLLFGCCLVFLSTCDHVLGGLSREAVEFVYTVRVSTVENGSIKPVPAEGTAGSRITLAVNPKPGYRLKNNGLQRSEGSGGIVEDLNLANPPYRFTMNNNNVVYAEFQKVAANNYTASTVDNIVGGSIVVYSRITDSLGEQLKGSYGTAGTKILLAVYPENGFALKEGSIKYSELDAQNKPVGNEIVLVPPYEFNLPAANVLITAEFESPAAAEFIESGMKALIRDDYDSAVIAFDAAYAKDPNNKEAIFYSTLGRLASIAVDPKVMQLLRSIGLGSYPGTLNNLLTLGDSWDNYETVPKSSVYDGKRPGWLEDFSGIRLPDTVNPGGFYAFQNQQGIIQDSKINGFSSIVTYQLIMFFNLMGSNISSLNDVIDDALRYALGDKFEAAAARAELLDYDDTIVLDQVVIDKLFLGNILTDGDHVGRSELNILFSALRVFKAGLEWVAAYDLETDRYLFRVWSYKTATTGAFFPTIPGLFYALAEPFVSKDVLDNLNTNWNPPASRRGLINDVTAFFLAGVDNFYKTNFNATRIPGMLPLRNHFLREREGAQATLNKSKNDLVKAIDGFLGSYDYYFSVGADIPQKAKDELANYKWIKDGLTKLKNVVNTGGSFYFSDTLPSGGTTWDYTQVNAKYGINLGKLYTPGQLTLDKLIVTTESGRKPVFYGWSTNTAIEGITINELENIVSYDNIGFKFNLKSLKEVLVKGLEKDGRILEDTEYVHTIFPDVLFNRQNGEELYTFYNDLYSYTNRK